MLIQEYPCGTIVLMGHPFLLARDSPPFFERLVAPAYIGIESSFTSLGRPRERFDHRPSFILPTPAPHMFFLSKDMFD